MDVVFLLLALFFVLLNGFFVAAEFSLVKVRPTRIEELIGQKKPGAIALRHMGSNLDGYLSATQLGITLASLALGWIGEPAFSQLIRTPLGLMGITDPVWVHRISMPLAFAIITGLHLIIGELVPKSMALIKTEAVALWVTYPMRAFYLGFFPIIWALNHLANTILRIIGINISELSPGGHSEEEIRIILTQARSAGLLSSAREALLTRALRLSTKNAKYLMVPRNDVEILDINLSLDENLKRASQSNHTRFPLCDRELDSLLGIVDIRQVLEAYRQNTTPELIQLATPARYYPEVMPAELILQEFRQHHIGMAIVVDEYGGSSGIVTPADIVTAVMGELDDPDEDEVVQVVSGIYEVEGATALEEIEEQLQISLSSDEMRTISGWLMEQLGRMPKPGDKITYEKFLFLVKEVQGPRVMRVRIQREKNK